MEHWINVQSVSLKDWYMIHTKRITPHQWPDKRMFCVYLGVKEQILEMSFRRHCSIWMIWKASLKRCHSPAQEWLSQDSPWRHLQSVHHDRASVDRQHLQKHHVLLNPLVEVLQQLHMHSINNDVHRRHQHCRLLIYSMPRCHWYPHPQPSHPNQTKIHSDSWPDWSQSGFFQGMTSLPWPLLRSPVERCRCLRNRSRCHLSLNNNNIHQFHHSLRPSLNWRFLLDYNKKHCLDRYKWTSLNSQSWTTVLTKVGRRAMSMRNWTMRSCRHYRIFQNWISYSFNSWRIFCTSVTALRCIKSRPICEHVQYGYGNNMVNDLIYFVLQLMIPVAS